MARLMRIYFHKYEPESKPNRCKLLLPNAATSLFAIALSTEMASKTVAAFHCFSVSVPLLLSSNPESYLEHLKISHFSTSYCLFVMLVLIFQDR